MYYDIIFTLWSLCIIPNVLELQRGATLTLVNKRSYVEATQVQMGEQDIQIIGELCYLSG